MIKRTRVWVGREKDGGGGGLGYEWEERRMGGGVDRPYILTPCRNRL